MPLNSQVPEDGQPPAKQRKKNPTDKPGKVAVGIKPGMSEIAQEDVVRVLSRQPRMRLTELFASFAPQLTKPENKTKLKS